MKKEKILIFTAPNFDFFEAGKVSLAGDSCRRPWNSLKPHST